jgi:SET domain-containing protein
MKSYINPKIEKAVKSKIHGLCLIAKDTILKNEVIAVKAGHILTLAEVEKLPFYDKHPELQITDKFFISPITDEEFLESMVYINHSCEPNIGMLGNIVGIAMRDIKKGEELVQDYATIDAREYKFKCHCGSNNCRGLITGNDWKIVNLQKKYEGYFSSYIAEKIRKEKL